MDVEEGNDPALPKTNVNGNSVDIGAGVYYMHGAVDTRRSLQVVPNT